MSVRSLAALPAAALLLLAGCAAAPTTGDDGAASTSDFVPCLVSTTGGFDDLSFNQFTLEGMQEAAAELGVETFKVQSDNEEDYEGNIQSMIDQGCTLIQTLGFGMIDATRVAAQANPEVDFIMLDTILFDENGDPLELDNVKPIVFQTREPSFLAGYVAAATTKTEKVGLYGGLQIPPVVDFMDGFGRGVEAYNEAKSASVEVYGWDVATQEGVFVGGFTDQNAAKTITEGLLDQGVDIVMPVAGSLFQATREASRDRGGEGLASSGGSSDGFDTAGGDFQSFYLTSVLKNMANATRDAVLQIAKDGFDNTVYDGTLANDGVGIAPFHDFEPQITPELQSELDALTQQIIDGTVDVG